MRLKAGERRTGGGLTPRDRIGTKLRSERNGGERQVGAMADVRLRRLRRTWPCPGIRFMKDLVNGS